MLGIDGPLVGRLGLGLVFFSFFKFLEMNFERAQKFHKKAPKLFINNIFIFRLIVIILFNYYFIY